MGGDFRARVNDGIEAGLMAAAQVCGERDNAAQSYVRHRHLWQKEREREVRVYGDESLVPLLKIDRFLTRCSASSFPFLSSSSVV